MSENRFIPAQAGNTSLHNRSPRSLTVHPRAGGEHQIEDIGHIDRPGSSPRRRGTRPGCQLPAQHVRFIPAQAGNTFRHTAVRLTFPVHPRAGGEHLAMRGQPRQVFGSSPRRRGTLITAYQIMEMNRFIPAQAGNTFSGPVSKSASAVHPRAGGEHSSCKLLIQNCFYIVKDLTDRKRGF
ncbi:Hypothetical protein GbCGDNIH6_1372 [Granulibacter bethesdensis]|nr:Hypothetical protein GbCGDNIH6_1372 [Granulibacter bethesdensis]